MFPPHILNIPSGTSSHGRAVISCQYAGPTGSAKSQPKSRNTFVQRHKGQKAAFISPATNRSFLSFFCVFGFLTRVLHLVFPSFLSLVKIVSEGKRGRAEGSRIRDERGVKNKCAKGTRYRNPVQPLG